MNIGRRLARRRAAYASFLFLMFFAISVTCSLLWADDRKEIAEALTAAQGSVTGFISSFTVIVLTYLGVSLVEAMNPTDTPDGQ